MDFHYPRLELPITIDQFHTLPRNAAYKYEYWDGRAVLSPRPKCFACARDLSPVEVDEPYPVRPLPAAEILDHVALFRGAHNNVQPIQSLDREAATVAARAMLEKTATGRDGPLIEPACFVADDPRGRSSGPVGGILITLAHPSVLTRAFGGDWTEPPPADAVERKLGVPHLTWVFVNPWMARRGVGTALLAAGVAALAGMGFTDLASTFALDNGPSALWHWRHRFRLLPQMSALKKEIDAERWASSQGTPGVPSSSGFANPEGVSDGSQG